MDVPVDFIKLDYMDLVRKYLRKDTSKLSNVTFVQNPKLGAGANTDRAKNIIEYGPYVDEVTIFHELEHIRKGRILGNNDGYMAKNDNEPNKVDVVTPRYGIFLDEAITEYVATTLFKKSPYFQPRIDIPKLQRRDFYKVNIGILGHLSKALNLDTLELCRLIELKHHQNDNTIDQKFNNMVQGMTFKEFEYALDKYESAHFIDYKCSINDIVIDGIKAEGCSSKTREEAKDSLISANFVLDRSINANRNNSRAW